MKGMGLIMKEKLNILGIEYDNVFQNEALDIVISFLDSDNCKTVVTPNSEIAQLCIENKEVKTAINSADLIIADGIGVIYASKILKKPLKQKVAGIDIAYLLLPILEKEQKSLFLLGGNEGIAELAKKNIKEKYPNINICGTQNGYFENEKEVIDKINAISPDVIFVCLGFPKQEIFMSKYKNIINAKVMLGLGGTLDIIAGNKKRAPEFFINLKLEWLYRLIKEPKRIVRMLKLPKYLFFAIKIRFRNE